MFKRKDKKFKRQWMLDVKGRSGPVKAPRLRMAAGALAVSAGVTIALFVSWKGGEYLLDRYVYSSARFGIERLEIESDGIIPLEQIRAWANVKRGDNLLALDLSRIKRDLELVPLIESAHLERVLPRQLIIRVREREPIARIVTFAPRPGDGLLEPSAIYLDEQGMVIPPVLRALNTLAFDRATRDVPNITGFSATGLRAGQRTDSPQLLAALRWIRAFQRSEMSGRANVRAIDVSSPTALLVSTEQGSEISFPPREFEPLLARWQGVQDFARQSRVGIATLDLVVTNYVPAQWVSLTNGVPPVRTVEPSPYRKQRHV